MLTKPPVVLEFYVVNGEIMIYAANVTLRELKTAYEEFESDLHKKNVDDHIANLWKRIGGE